MAIIQAFPLIIPPLIQGTILLITTLIDELTKEENVKIVQDGAFELLYAIIDAIPDIVIAIVDALPQIIDGIYGTITSPRFRRKMGEAGSKLMGALGESIVTIVKGLPKIIWSVLKLGINHLINWVETAINTPINIINGAIGAINKLPGVEIGKIPNISIPRLAEGGIVTSATLAMVGEGGESEAVIPLSKLENMIGSGGNNGNKVEINIHMEGVMSRSKTDLRAIAKDLIGVVNDELRAKGQPEIGNGSLNGGIAR